MFADFIKQDLSGRKLNSVRDHIFSYKIFKKFKF